MMIELSTQTVITAAGFATAIGTLITLIVKVVRWMDRQAEQDKKITELEAKLEKQRAEFTAEIENIRNGDLRDIKEELSMMTYTQLVSLKGIKQIGADGAEVTDAITMLEKHLNKQAHK